MADNNSGDGNARVGVTVKTNVLSHNQINIGTPQRKQKDNVLKEVVASSDNVQLGKLIDYYKHEKQMDTIQVVSKCLLGAASIIGTIVGAVHIVKSTRKKD
ncbi:MAG: hypothetical protein ACI35O_12695 [Bacillaceae bacterium]